jgi:hypothetical protein
MTVSLTNWEPYILPHIPEVPGPALEMAIRDAAIDFCRDTLIWKEWLTRITVTALDKDYPLALPASFDLYGDIESVYQVYFKETGADDDQFALLYPTTEDEMETNFGGGWMFSDATQPSRYYISASDPTNLFLYPIPTVTATLGLLVRVYCVPLETAQILPDFLYASYKNAVKAGALSRLFGVRGMPWYDKGEEAKWGTIYGLERDNAIVAATKGPIRKEMRVAMRNWI